MINFGTSSTMGIKQLKKTIRSKAPDAISTFKMGSLYSQSVVIDSSILLYKFRYIYKEDTFHIIGFVHKIIELLGLGTNPIFVFDGAPPAAKQNVLQERNNQRSKMKERLTELQSQVTLPDLVVDEFIDSDSEEDPEIKKAKEINAEIKKIKKNLLIVNKKHSLEVIELLDALGIPFFESFGEAEESCVYLQKKGFAKYILTEDTDSLAFGGTNVICYGKNNLELLSLETVLSGLNLSYPEFVDFCILCGCDYTNTIPKVGPVSALNLIKRYHSIESILENTKYTAPESFDYSLARTLFRQNEEYPERLISRSTFQLEKAERLFEKYQINTDLLTKIKRLINF